MRKPTLTAAVDDVAVRTISNAYKTYERGAGSQGYIKHEAPQHNDTICLLITLL
jgi:hypothetical protein